MCLPQFHNSHCWLYWQCDRVYPSRSLRYTRSMLNTWFYKMHFSAAVSVVRHWSIQRKQNNKTSTIFLMQHTKQTHEGSRKQFLVTIIRFTMPKLARTPFCLCQRSNHYFIRVTFELKKSFSFKLIEYWNGCNKIWCQLKMLRSKPKSEIHSKKLQTKSLQRNAPKSIFDNSKWHFEASTKRTKTHNKIAFCCDVPILVVEIHNTNKYYKLYFSWLFFFSWLVLTTMKF